MKKSYYILLAAATMSIAGCSEPEQQEEEGGNEEATVNVEWNIPEGTTMAVADIDIKGMTCEMMCVNKVNSSLSGLEGVTKCDIDFNPENEVNRATVTFDPNKLGEQDLIKAITGIADGIYSIQNLSVSAAQNDVNTNETPDDGETASLNNNATSSLSLPNILEIFYSLF